MTWKEAVLKALRRLSRRHLTTVLKRQTIIEEELMTIVIHTGSRGKTPEQTLNRTLQDLRDDGKIIFLDNKGTYHLVFLEDLPPADISVDYKAPPRAPATIHRIKRDTAIIARLKSLYEYQCQICGLRIRLQDRYYCEAHHLRPLGEPHSGPDIEDNIIIVCPNHHVQLDYGALQIHVRDLLTYKHRINQEYISYHNNVICHPAAREEI
ncbi:HNH endonuclease [Oceanithermus profundus]|uniref:HNH endonuclease n=1 Tax=Oceanithermus profundus TaxID=187137 RepID=UPI000A035466|nr:HNH endonuclease [Oceanithermus profundus]